MIKTEDLNPQDGTEKAQIFVPVQERDTLKEKDTTLNFTVTVTISDGDVIDVGPSQCSKGISILEICDKYHINRQDIIAIGVWINSFNNNPISITF